MAAPFTIDGVAYNVIVPIGGLKRNFTIRDGRGAAWAKSGRKRRDVQGTYYNYSVEIDTSYLTRREYDDLYEVLSAPVESHTVVMPYGQDVLEFEAAIYNGEDSLHRITENGTLWRGLVVEFEALMPHRVPL